MVEPEADPPPAEAGDAAAMWRRRRDFNSGVVEAITILADLLMVTGVLDRERFDYMLQGHIAALTESTPEHPYGINPARALPLMMLRQMLSKFGTAAPFPGKAN